MFLRKKTPARRLLEAAKELAKLRRHEKDRLAPANLTRLEEAISELKRVGGGGRPTEEEAARHMGRAEKLYAELAPRVRHPSIAENVDVILVAVVVALGIRSYFLQPFKIPTNSMFPTLRGIVVTKLESEQEIPNPVQRVAEAIFCGRAYLDFELPAGAQVMPHHCQSKGIFFLKRLHLVYEAGGAFQTKVLATEATFDDVDRGVGLLPRSLEERAAHERAPRRILARVDTGDHLFVNKVAYHFSRPARGDSFVFRTTGLKTSYNLGRDPRDGSQYYIKRCVGGPGDVMRVDPPRLLIGGEEAKEPEMRRVFSGRPGYNGYSNRPANGPPFRYLGTPEDTYAIPADGYWAMGDNSYNSQDSRQWGHVPLENVVGKAFIIYYPFNRKFWLIE